MTFDIQEHARSAQAAYQAALARLNTARTAYETGGGAAYAAAKAQRDLLERKIKEADDEVRTAKDAYHQAWAADNFENTARVREVLARKHESEATCEALRVALARSEQDMQRHLLDASVRHLGTENNLHMLEKTYEYLKDKVEFRFECPVKHIETDGKGDDAKVSAWRIGVAPQVDYVEGCS